MEVSGDSSDTVDIDTLSVSILTVNKAAANGTSPVVNVTKAITQGVTINGNGVVNLNGGLNASAATFNAGDSVEVNFAAGTHVINILDISRNEAASKAKIHLKEDAELTVNSQLWMGPSSSILLEEGASLIKGSINIAGLSTATPATLKKTTNGGEMYDVSKSSFAITNANVTANSGSELTLGNSLQNSKVVNAGKGELKLTNANNVLTDIEAKAGSISMESLANNQALESLYIGDALTVNVGSATLSIQEAAINQQGARVTNVTFGDNAKLQGNLVLQSGAALSLGEKVQIDGTLTLGNDMTLTGAQLEEIQALKERVELFHNVDQLKLTDALARSGAAVDYTQAQDLSQFFSNVDSGVYLLEFDSGVVYATLIPEPATGTLSLLALAALAARRRRRH